MENQLSILDQLRTRYLKGEPLLQYGDSYDVAELIEAMNIIDAEAKAQGRISPIAIAQPK